MYVIENSCRKCGHLHSISDSPERCEKCGTLMPAGIVKRGLWLILLAIAAGIAAIVYFSVS